MKETLNTEFGRMGPDQCAATFGNHHVCTIVSINASLQLQYCYACLPILTTNNYIAHFMGSAEDRRDSLGALLVLGKEVLG